VKHSDDENELFHRPEAEMTDDSGAEVVDLGKARTARLASRFHEAWCPTGGQTNEKCL
jgi:hypothetical protein